MVMPELSGRIAHGRHELAVRVYYEDTDFSGLVYHANYLKYCERGRSDCLRALEIDQVALAAEQIHFVVRKMDCEFLRPARFDDVLTVETTGAGSKGARLLLRQRVLRGDDALFTADVVVAVIDGKGRPQRLQGALAEKLQVFAKIQS